LVRPYYVVPESKVGHDTFAVIRETIRTMDKVAIVVLANREHIIALEARHIVESKSADFEPGEFEDRYENALVALLNQKRKGVPIRTVVKPRDSGNVVNLMDALRKSLSDVGKGAISQNAKGRKPKQDASGQREMLMAIAGKGEGKAKGGAKETRRPTDTAAQGGLMFLFETAE
jgi:DNA end-binding protein Ku